MGKKQKKSTSFEKYIIKLKEWHTWASQKEVLRIKHKHDYDIPAKTWLSVLLIAILFYFIIFYYFSFFKYSYNESILPKFVQELVQGDNCEYYSKLDGTCSEIDDRDLPVFAAMIENHNLARPTYGVQEASIVYEALVEGPITRFMAIYGPNNTAETIGPIRSARPYYVDWAHEYDAMYAHVGGSPDGLDKISKLDIKDFDEYSKGRFFWRSKKRNAPHNVFTSTEELSDGYRIYYESEEVNALDTWKFKDEADYDTRGENNQLIYINQSTDSYNVFWQYNQEKNIYERYQAEEKYLDGNNEHVTSKNVLVVFSDTEVLDNVGRRKFDIIGSGQGVLFRDGKEYPLTWKKESTQARTQYYNEYNKRIQFNRGKTWIHIIPTYAETKVVMPTIN